MHWGSGSVLLTLFLISASPTKASSSLQEAAPFANINQSEYLPLDFGERDVLLQGFYEIAIPLLISWDLAHGYRLRPYFEKVTDFNFVRLFGIDTPYNPYRKPFLDKLYFFPTTLEE